MNWEQGPKAAIWYVAVAAIVIVSYLLQVLIHFLRDFVARKMGKSESSQRVEDGEAHNHAMTKIETTNSSVV